MSDNETKVDSSKKQLKYADLGNQVPRRGGRLSPRIGRVMLKALGWKVVGSIPNVPKAVFIGLPHTSNFDGLYTIPMVLGLDLDLRLMGKDSLFKNPMLSKFFKWAGIIPINRSKKGSVLQAAIDQMKASDSLFLGLAPEGTRGYTDKFKTGFYYIAKEAEVPIIPVAMDYKTKQIRFLTPVYPSGDFEADMNKILSQYKGVVPKYPEKMSKPLQEVNK